MRNIWMLIMLSLFVILLLTFCGKGEKTGTGTTSIVSEKVEKKEGELTKEDIEGYILPELTPTAQVLIRACDNFEKEYSDDKRMPNVLAKEGETYFFFKHYDPAIVAFMEIYNKYPESEQYVIACESIAKIYFERGQYGESERWYALTKEAATKFNKTDLIAAMDKMEKAATYKKAESLVTKEDIALLEKSTIKPEGEGSTPEGEIPPKKDIPPEVRSKFIKQAEEFLTLADKSKGEDIGKKALGDAANAYESVEEWEKAAEVYIKFASEYPEDEKTMNAWFTAGERYEQAGNYRKAAETFNKIFNMYPYEKFPDTDDGNLKKALVIEALYKAATNYEKLEDWNKVIECYSKYGETPSTDAEKLVKASFKVATSYEKLGRHSDAIEAYKKVVGIYTYASDHGFDVSKVADMPAKSLLAISQDLFDDYDAIDFHLPEKSMQASFNKKLELAQKLNAYYESMMKYNIPEFSTAAIFMMGKVYEEFADTWRYSEKPDFPNFAQEAQYTAILLENTSPFLEKTVNFFDQVIGYANSNNVENEWVDKARDKLLENIFKWAEISEECSGAYEKAINPPGMTPEEIIDYQSKLGDYLNQFFDKKDQYDNMAETLYKKVEDVALAYNISSEWVNKAKEKLISLRPAMYASGEDFTGKNIVSDWGWKVSTSSTSTWNQRPSDPFNWECESWETVSRGVILEKNKYKITGFRNLPEAEYIWAKSSGLADTPPPSPIYTVRKLTLHKKPRTHIVYISAMEAYTLYVNGKMVGSDTKGGGWKTAESYDITPYLIIGDNIIAVEAFSTNKEEYWVKVEVIEEGATSTYKSPEPAPEEIVPPEEETPIEETVPGVGGEETTEGTIESETGGETESPE
ncbi:MAG: tetratricopeptide repeat protein [bacterium]